MAKMHGSTYLLNRNGRYYFRRPIPSELRAAFNGIVEFKQSLRTSDKSRARALVERLTRETSEQLEAAKRRINPQWCGTITAAELDAFAREHVAKLLRQDETARLGASDSSLEELAYANSALIDVVETRPPHRWIRDEADELLASKGLVMDHGSTVYLQLVEVVRDATEDALRQLLRRDEGERVPTPAAPVQSPALSKVREKWAEMGGKKGHARSKSVDEAKATVDAFISLHGDLQVSAITKQHGIALRDHFRAKGNSLATIRKKLGLLNAVLAFAVREDYIATSLLRGVQVPKGGKAKRRGFTMEELQTLFAHPVFMSGQRGDATSADAAFWVPLMALYSGARIGELAQLRVADFKRDAAHGWYYEIHEREEGMHVKNDPSVRIVPVHPELERIGLLDEVTALQKSRESRLFPTLTTRRNGQAGSLSAAINRTIDAAGLADPNLVAHSFRHTFITLARDAEIPGDVLREVVGHEGGRDVHLGYGEFSLAVKASAMRRIIIRGLDLSRVRPPR